MSPKILLSTDIGSDIDDALALLAMFNADLNPEVIYTANGDVRSRSYIAKKMVDLSGKDIKVAVGESKPLGGPRPYSFYEDAYVDDSFIDEERSKEETEIQYKPFKKLGMIPNGAEDLETRLKKQKYTVFSIAPMTNIAKAIKDSPEAAKNIERLYIMGFRFSDASEHNIRYDSVAADIVLNSDIRLTIVPGDLCERYRMPAEVIDQLSSPCGKYVKQMARGFLAAKTYENFVRQRIVSQDGSYIDLKTALEEEVERPEALIEKGDVIGIGKLRTERTGLINTIDDGFYGASSPEKYFRAYKKLIERLRDPQMGFRQGERLAKLLELLIPTQLSIADVYVPYCYLHPEKLIIEKGTVACTPEGRSTLKPGQKHDIVQDLDFDHFRNFVLEHLK